MTNFTTPLVRKVTRSEEINNVVNSGHSNPAAMHKGSACTLSLNITSGEEGYGEVSTLRLVLLDWKTLNPADKMVSDLIILKIL